jgi:EAL domain-containing protein (putative c-di-GMP-specific phosphodiesterase class I)
MVELPDLVVDDPGCLAEVEGALAQWPVDPGQVVLELRDAAAAAASPAAVRTLGALRDLGLTVAARDFGGRRAPAAIVRDLPITAVSFDPALTTGVGDEAAAGPLLAAAVQLARALVLGTCAVDVATPTQAEALGRAGVHTATGSWWGRPMAPADLEAWAALRS